MPNHQKANDTKLNPKNKVALCVNTFDGDHAGNVANSAENSVEVFFIEDFNRYFDLSLVVAGDDRTCISDSGLDVRDGVGDAG